MSPLPAPPSPLATDLYELTMMAGYRAAGLDASASFELFVREMPRTRSYLVAAGMEQALDCLEGLRFTPEEIAYLRRVPMFETLHASFFDDYLPSFRFTGDVWAMAEGTPFFAREPVLRVTAPIAEAQLVETVLLATIGFQTSVASKAARIVEAASGRSVVEFGSRRAHGTGAALLAARAAWLAGCSGTSNVEAGLRFGVPVSGTMAHSWVMSFGSEMESFEEFFRVYGERTTFLLDTYDTLAAAHAVARSGMRPGWVRLDSGDLLALSRQVRAILDSGGLGATRILASGDLDEHKIAALVAEGAPIDGFGVGTALSTSKDAPALPAVYKTVAIERGGQNTDTMKLSEVKVSFPGAKQVWRLGGAGGGEESGTAERDVLGLEGEAGPRGGRPLLRQVMRGGRRTEPPPPLHSLREACVAAVAGLPADVRRLDRPVPYPVVVSDAIRALAERLAASPPGR